MKRRKNTRLRGSHTHGGGAKKKRRGAGNRGGRGRAGSGKKGDAKKPMFWKEKPSKGFHSIQKVPNNPINVGDLHELGLKLKQTEFDLKKMGHNKLLAMGDTNLKLKITVSQASASAIRKIERAGGKVTVDKKEEKPKVEAPQKKEKPVVKESPAEAGEEKKEETPKKEEKTEAPKEEKSAEKPKPAKD